MRSRMSGWVRCTWARGRRLAYRCKAILEWAVAEVSASAANVKVPEDLGERVREQLAHAPGQAWDDAIEGLVPLVDIDE